MQQLLTYRVITRLSVLLLCIGFLFPTALCATQLSGTLHDSESSDVNESAQHSMQHGHGHSPDDRDNHTPIPASNHQFATPTHSPDSHMCDSHSGSQTTNDRTPSKNCMDIIDCSCELGQTSSEYQLWPKSPGNAVAILVNSGITIKEQSHRPGISFQRFQRYKALPLYLLNSTFLT